MLIVVIVLVIFIRVKYLPGCSSAVSSSSSTCERRVRVAAAVGGAVAGVAALAAMLCPQAMERRLPDDGGFWLHPRN